MNMDADMKFEKKIEALQLKLEKEEKIIQEHNENKEKIIKEIADAKTKKDDLLMKKFLSDAAKEGLAISHDDMIAALIFLKSKKDNAAENTNDKQNEPVIEQDVHKNEAVVEEHDEGIHPIIPEIPKAFQE
jgi:hypothetical protein